MSIFLRPAYGKNQLSAKQILTDPVLFLAFAGGSGLIKKMPGTCGTAAAIPLYVCLSQFNGSVFGAAVLLACVAGIPICGIAAQKLGEHDYGGIVWDEVAGFLITMAFVPFSGLNLLAGFALFRFFDIVKPWPIGWLDAKVDGGLGIMLDDIVAGLLAALSLWAMVAWGVLL
jgi:phosphatidylglycerophosphatase A